eukprot:11967447-Alexandrium_andersonii.AAC.1
MEPPSEPHSTPPERPPSAIGLGISANNGAEGTPRELRTPRLRPLLGPRSSSSERLKQFLSLIHI